MLGFAFPSTAGTFTAWTETEVTLSVTAHHKKEHYCRAYITAENSVSKAVLMMSRL